MLTLIQAGNRIDLEIHAESVAQLIGHELGIDACLTGETGMGAAHDLKRGPAELDRLQPWRNEPTPGVVAAEWRGPLCRRKDPRLGICRPTLFPPFSNLVSCRRRQCDVSCRAFALWSIEFPAIETLRHLDVIVGDMLPLQCKNLTGSHAGKQSQPNDELLARAEHREDLLDLCGR